MKTKDNTKKNVQKNWKALEDTLKESFFMTGNNYHFIENFLKSLKKEDLFELYKENIFRLSKEVFELNHELDAWGVEKSERLNSLLSGFLVTNFNLTKKEKEKVLFYNFLTKNINDEYKEGFYFGK